MSLFPKYTHKIAGATVLIIGGSSGIGFGLAEACIENHVARIILASSRQTKIDSAIARLKSSYPNESVTIEGHVCDLSDEKTLESNIETLFRQVGSGIDHVVSTAGDPLQSIALEQVTFQSILQGSMVRFFAPFFIAKTAARYMTPGPKSSITFTGGAGGDKPVPNRPVINAISSGLHGLVRSLALDLRPVRVNLVSPCATDTEFWENVLGPDAQEKKLAIFKAQATQLATGQVAHVEDVVESFLYALKEKNVTGTVIRSDGGKLIM